MPWWLYVSSVALTGFLLYLCDNLSSDPQNSHCDSPSNAENFYHEKQQRSSNNCCRWSYLAQSTFRCSASYSLTCCEQLQETLPEGNLSRSLKIHSPSNACSLPYFLLSIVDYSTSTIFYQQFLSFLNSPVYNPI